jgi:spore coat polysaccharide biosynthesis protein SpsF
MKTVAIVQARVGSSRLPNKILKRLGRKTVLQIVLERLRLATLVDEVCCATSDLADDDEVEAEAKKHGFCVFRGKHEDVLNRYASAAKELQAETIVRVTSDCPCVDPKIVDGLVALREKMNADYVSNNMPRSWPIGMDVEVFTNNVLQQANIFAIEADHREHVSPWMRVSKMLRRANLSSKQFEPVKTRLTIDYREDYEFFRHLILAAPGNELPLSFEDTLALIQSRRVLINYFASMQIVDPKYDFGALEHTEIYY